MQIDVMLFSSMLKYVGGDSLARQILAKNRSLHAVNEDFLSKFNAARASKVVFQQAVRRLTDFG